MRVGRLARGIRRQGAAPLHHHAQAAKAKHLDLDIGALGDLFDLLQRQHARQHGALDVELLLVQVDRVVVGGRALYRQVQAQLRVPVGGVAHQAGVGQDDGINPPGGGAVQRRAPGRGVAGLRIGVQRHQHLAAPAVGVGDAFLDGFFVKVQASKVACVGGIAQAQVNAIGSAINGRFQGGQAAGGADQFRGGSQGEGGAGGGGHKQ